MNCAQALAIAAAALVFANCHPAARSVPPSWASAVEASLSWSEGAAATIAATAAQCHRERLALALDYASSSTSQYR